MKNQPTSKPGLLKPLAITVSKIITFCIVLALPALKVNAANRYWVALLNSNWNNVANWSTTSGGLGGASVPGTGDAVIFDNARLSTCTIDVAVSVASITINGYLGTISQGANTIAVSGAVSMNSGTFTGGSAAITITGAFGNSGASFTSTSGILELRNDAAFTSGSFSHNNGTVRFNGGGSQVISGVSPTFYVLEFVGKGNSYTLSSTGNITVTNSLNITGTLFYNLVSGVIDVQGNINSSNTATGCGGDAQININGTGSQTFTGSSVICGGALPKLNINKSSGTLSLVNYPTVSNDFTYTAGTVNAGVSTFCFGHGNTGSYAIAGSLSLNNISFYVNTGLLTLNIGSSTTITATGNISLDGIGNLILNTGNINVNGNVTLTNTGTSGGGSASINMVGSGTQTIDGSAVIAGQCRLPILTINKSSGTLAMTGNISLSNNIIYTAGTISPGTSTCYIVNTNISVAGNFTMNNLTISTTGNAVVTVTSGSTLTINNTLDMESGANSISFNTGTISVLGDITDNNTGTGGGGTGTMLINGTGNQNITSTGVMYQGNFPAVSINKSSGTLTFPSLMTVRGNWTYTAGTIDGTTNNSTIVFANTLTISGNQSLQNITVDGSGSYTVTIQTGNTVTVNGNMAISGANNILINTGTINLNGNLNLTNTATNGGGTGTIAFVGNGAQNITSALAIYQSSLPGITINKSAGTLTLPALITERGNWTYTSGTLDVITNNSNVVFGNTLSISGAHTLNNITFDGGGNYTYTLSSTINASGNMSMSGSGNLILNGGTINLNGNLLLTNTATAGTGSSVINFMSSANQNIISSLSINQCNLPSVTINKPSGTLTFPSIITVRGNWTYTAGTLDVTTNSSTVAFNNNLNITGSHSLNNVNLEGLFNNTYSLPSGTVLTVMGNLTTSGTNSVSISAATTGATVIQALGDIIINNTGTNGGGTGAINISGTGAQSLTGNAASGLGRLPYIKIQKASGTLSMSGIISASRDWTYTSGTVSPGASTVVFGGNNLTVTTAGMNFNNVSIASNTTTLASSLTLNGDLTISGTAILAPSTNTVNVAGNWSNWGAGGFTETGSTINFNGSSLQTINTTGGETFAGLTINNRGAGIQLASNATTSGTLTMTQGNIDLNGKIFTLGISAGVRGTLARTSGTMINSGSFVRWVGTGTIASGATSGLFPMGTSTFYRPIFVSAPSSGPTAAGTISATYTDATSNTSVAFADGASTVMIRKDLNWALAAANGLSGGTYELSAQGTGFGTVGSITDLRLTLVNSVVGVAGTNAGTTSSPQVNRTGLAATDLNNSFYIGSINAVASPLPITLIDFMATVATGKVKLEWATAMELNNDHFTIQRSQDGKQFHDIAEIKAVGNSNAINNYVSYDENPLRGVSYYRLVQTDIDGQVSFSGIREISIVSQTSFNFYPNPTSNYVVIDNGGQPVDLQVYDVEGHQLYPQIKFIDNRTTVFMSPMRAGIYFLRLHDEAGTRMIQIIKR